jgi:hypothetical protein
MATDLTPHPERSSYLFTLANNAGFPLQYGGSEPIEDDAFLWFAKEYKS